jgi:hypothetical protein
MAIGRIIKVQVIDAVSTESVIESGIESTKDPLTFHAHSDRMKARVLERFMVSGGTIGLSFIDGSPREGEWHEEMALDAVFCPVVE